MNVDTSPGNGNISITAMKTQTGIDYWLYNLALNAGSGTITLADYAGTAFAGANTLTTAVGGVINSSAQLSTGAFYFANTSLATSSTISGVISTAGSFTKAGPGTMIFTATNTMSGTASVLAGTLQVGASGTTGSLGTATVTGAASALLAFNRSDAVTFSNTLTGGLGVAQNGSGTLTLSGSNSYTGNTAINTGILAITNTNSLPGWNTAGRYTVAADAALSVPNSVDDPTLGTLVGTGNFAAGSYLGFDTTAANRTYTLNLGSLSSGIGLAKTGTNTLILSATNTYTGPTLVTGGTLQIGAGGTAGSIGATSRVNIASGAVVAFNRTDDYGGAFVPGISGSGAVTIASGTLTLSGSNSFSGSTTLTSGVLGLNNANALQNSTLNASGSNAVQFGGGIGTFNLGGLASGTNSVRIALTDAASQPIALCVGSNNASTTFYGGLTGSGTLVKVGTGALTLDTKVSSGAGAFTYSGGTYLLAGTLRYGSSAGNGVSNKLGSGTVYLGDTTGSSNVTLQQIYNSDTLPNNIVVQSGNTGTVTIQASGGNDAFSGTITLGSPNSAGKGLTIAGANLSFGFSNVIQDPSGMTPGTAGTVTIAGSPVIFSAANTYTGPTVVASGVLVLNNAGAIQNSASVTGSTGGTIQVQGGLSFATPLTLSGSGYSGQTGALVNNSSNNTWSGPITLAGASTISSNSGMLDLSGTVSGTQNLTLAGAGWGEVPGAISIGSGTLAKAGTGVWTLNSAPVAGAVSLNAGSLSVNNTAILSGIPLNFNGGNLRITGTSVTSLSGLNANWTAFNGGLEIPNSAAGIALGQALSGTGALTKLGAGTLTLNGTAANTYTGATNVNGGTLALDFTNLATPTNLIGSSSALNLGGGLVSIKASGTGSTSQTFNGTTLNAGGGSVLVNPNNGVGSTVALGTITGTAAGGSLLVGTAPGAGSGTVTVTTAGAKNATGIYGGRVVFTDGSNYDWAGTGSGSAPYTLNAYSGYSALSMVTGTDTNNSRITASATLSGAVGTNTLKIENPGASQTLDLGAASLALAGGGLLATGANAFTIQNGTLTGGNGAGAFDLVIQQFNSAGLNISATIANSGTTATALTKAGSGTLTLSGSLASTGPVAVNAGRLTLTPGSYPIASGAARTISVATGATLELNATAGTNFLPADNGQALTISGGGTLVKTGSGTMVLCNSNTLETLAMSAGSLIDVQGGTLQASTNNHGNMSSNQASINIGPGATFNGGELSVSLDVLTGSGTYTDGYGDVTTTLGVANGSGTFSGTVQNQQGTLSIVKVGSGTQVLSGSCTYGGSTTVNGGTLQFGAGGTTGNLPYNGTLTDVTGLAGATLAFNRSDSVVVYNGINGALGVTQNGTGMTTIGQVSLYTGPTLVNSGTLQIGNGNSGRIAPSSAVTVMPGATLAINLPNLLSFANSVSDSGFVAATGSNSNTLSGVISGSGGFAQMGTGLTTITGSNSYTGPTTITSGTLSLGSGGTVGSIASTSGIGIGASGRLLFNRTDNYGGNWQIPISGSGAVTLASGTLTLSGGNSFSGATTFTGGVLNLSNANALQNSTLNASGSNAVQFGSGIGTFNVGGLASGTNTVRIALADTSSQPVTLRVGANNASTTFYGGLTGSGTLVKVGTGTLSLDQNIGTYATGANTYSGGTYILAGTLRYGSSPSGNWISNMLGTGTVFLGDTGGSLNAALQQIYNNNTLPNNIVVQSGNTGTATILSSGGNDGFSGTITLGSPNSIGKGITFAGNGLSLTVSGTIQDPVGMAPGTAGTVTIAGNPTFTGANTYTGPTVVASGVLSISNANALQNTASLSGSSGGTISLGGGISLGMPITLSGSGASGQTGAMVSSGTNFLTGATTLAADSTISSNSGFLWLCGTISGNQNLTLGGAGSGEVPGTLALGSGTLAKAGTGVWTLDGTMTAGAVSLNAGSLSIDNTAILSGATLNFNGGNLRITGTSVTSLSGQSANWTAFNGGLEISNSAASIAVGQALSGTGALTKLGAGTLTLNGTAANAYTGATSVKGGTLVLDFTNLAMPTDLIGSSSALNLSGGGVVSIKANGTGSTSQTFNGATLNAGGGSVLVNPNNGAGTTVALGAITGTAAGGSLLVGTAPGAGSGTVTVTAATAPDATGILGGRVVFTDGSSYDWAGSASGGAPYTLGAYSGYSALATATGTDSNNSRITTGATLAGTVGTNTLKIENPAALQSLALGGNTLTLTGGGLLSTGSNAFAISGGALTAGNGAGSYDLLVHQFNTGGLTISGTIANSGTNATALTKAGPGTLTLSGSLAATGPIAVNAGRLTLAPGSYPIASGAARTISVATGATLELSATAAGYSFLPADGGQTLTISGGGTLVKTGTGTIILCNSNTLGTLAMSAGSLIDVQGGRLAASTNYHGNMSSNQASVNIAAGATFDAGELSVSLDALTGSGTYTDGYGAVTTTLGVANGSGTFSGAVQNQYGTLSILKIGSGTQVFSGSCTYGGSTTVNDGTLQFGAGGTTGNLPAASSVTGLAGARLAFNRSDSIVISNTISGGLGLTQNGAGLLTLSASNTYTGNTVVNSGTLQIGNGSTGRISPASVVTVMPGATLAVNLKNSAFANSVSDSGVVAVTGTNSNTISSVISGSGGFAQRSTGLTAITGSNSYTGTTAVSSGTLQLGNANALGSGPVTMNGGTLNLAGYSAATGALSGSSGTLISNMASGTSVLSTTVSSGTSTYAGNMLNGAGAVALTKQGAGALILSGSIGMAGLTAEAGTVQLASSGSIGALVTGSAASVVLSANTNGTRTVLSISSLSINGVSSGMAATASAPSTLLHADSLAGPTSTVATAPASPEAVPEPGVWSLVAGGMGMLLGNRRLRRRPGK